MELGSLLRKTRKYVGLTQAELAKMLECNASDISRTEHEQMSLSAERLLKWLKITGRPDILAALALGVDIDTMTERMFKMDYLKQVYKLGFLEEGIREKEDFKKLKEIIYS